MKVSVIIPYFNSQDTILDCVKALKRQKYSGDFEIIIIDNGSNVPLDSLLPQDNQIIIKNESAAGSYVARNKGVQNAKGELLLFTDADCIPDKGWIAAAVDSLGPDECKILGGAIQMFPENDGFPTAVELHEMVFGLQQEKYVKMNGFAATANLITNKKTIEFVGGFDPGLYSGGDREWCFRAVKKGVVLEFCAAARIYHPCRKSLKQLLKKNYRVATGSRDIFEKGVKETLSTNTVQYHDPAALKMKKIAVTKLTSRKDITLIQKLQVLWIAVVVITGGLFMKTIVRKGAISSRE